MEIFLAIIYQPEWMAPEVLRNEQSNEKWVVFWCFHLTVSLSPISLILDVLWEVIQHLHGYMSLSSRGTLVFFLLNFLTPWVDCDILLRIFHVLGSLHLSSQALNAPNNLYLIYTICTIDMICCVGLKINGRFYLFSIKTFLYFTELK